jgi:hypothetical protein
MIRAIKAHRPLNQFSARPHINNTSLADRAIRLRASRCVQLTEHFPDHPRSQAAPAFNRRVNVLRRLRFHRRSAAVTIVCCRCQTKSSIMPINSVFGAKCRGPPSKHSNADRTVCLCVCVCVCVHASERASVASNPSTPQTELGRQGSCIFALVAVLGSRPYSVCAVRKKTRG